MVVSKRDRLARGLYAGYLKNEFKRRGVELAALDSITEDTPYGELWRSPSITSQSSSGS